MKYFVLLATVLLSLLNAGAVLAQDAKASLKQQLVGTWQIVSGVMQVGDEVKPTPLGSDLTGLLIYTADGHMCFNAMKADRPKMAGGDRAGGTVEQKSSAYDSYRSFCGRYDVVSEADRVISHSYQLALLPDSTGTTEKRFILELTPTTLKFRTTPHVVAGKETFGVWTFKRAQ